MKKFTSLIATVVILIGYTSANSGNNITASPSNVTTFGTALNGKQLRKLLVGKTIVGRSYNFPSVGPFDFWVYYSPNGTSKDRLKFVRDGRIDRATGTWKIIDEAQGIFCSQYANRRKGVETCARFYVSKNRFRTKPTKPGRKGVTGKIVPGNQVQ